MGLLSSLCDDTRADWGAVSPSYAVYAVPITDKDQFLTHWDGDSALGLADKPHSACLARVRADQQFHMGSARGWADIGYNTLVCPHGRLIEGRGVLTVGAQCPGYNRSGVGSQMMVGRGDKIPAVMLTRQRQFYDELVAMRHETMRKMAHRDGTSTSCPGDQLAAWVHQGMPIGVASPIPSVPSVVKPPAKANPPGPRHPFPLPAGYYFGTNDGSRYSVSGRYGRVFRGRADRSWLQEFGSQMARRGWSVGRGKKWLPSGNDGYFGPEYAALVKAFQNDRGLTADAKLGKRTWDAAFLGRVS